MLPERELHTRLEQSLTELKLVADSLQEVKRLADSHDASTHQMAKVATAMDGVASQLGTLLTSVGASGSALHSATALLKDVDLKTDLANLSTKIAEVITNTEAAIRTQKEAHDLLVTSNSEKFSGLSVTLRALELRGRIGIIATWLIVILAAVLSTIIITQLHH